MTFTRQILCYPFYDSGEGTHTQFSKRSNTNHTQEQFISFFSFLWHHMRIPFIIASSVDCLVDKMAENSQKRPLQLPSAQGDIFKLLILSDH